MLYALAMPSSSSPCGDGARNAKRVLGEKKSAPKRVHPTLTLLSFARKKEKYKRKKRRKEKRKRRNSLCSVLSENEEEQEVTNSALKSV